MDNCRSEEYALTPGVLRLISGRWDRDEVEKNGVYAGRTADGCTLRYEYSEKVLYDTAGEVAGTLRYGERAVLEGRLSTVTPEAAGILTEGGTLSANLACPLPDGEELCVHVTGAMPRGVAFAMKEGGGVSFTLSCGRGYTSPRVSFGGGAV